MYYIYKYMHHVCVFLGYIIHIVVILFIEKGKRKSLALLKVGISKKDVFIYCLIALHNRTEKISASAKKVIPYRRKECATISACWTVKAIQKRFLDAQESFISLLSSCLTIPAIKRPFRFQADTPCREIRVFQSGEGHSASRISWMKKNWLQMNI